MENLEFNLAGALQEVRGRAEAEGALTQEEWNDIVDTYLDEKLSGGELDEDQDLAQIRESLYAKFDDFEDNLEVM